MWAAHCVCPAQGASPADREVSSPFGPMVLICNAGAGGGGAGRALAEVRRHLDERELEHEIHFTERSGHATERYLPGRMKC